MPAYVTVFEEAAPVARWASAAWGAGLFSAGMAALWLLRGRDWGIVQFVAGVPALIGALVMFGLLLPQGAAGVLEGVVSGYGRRGGSACFTVQGQEVCAGDRMPVRNGQKIRVSRVGMAPVRIEVDRASLMTEKDMEEREREARRRDEPFQRAVFLGILPVAAGLFGWTAVYWRRSLSLWVSPPHGLLVQVSFRGFMAMNAISALVRFGQELRLHPLTADEAMPATIALLAIGAVTSFGFRHFVREVERRRRAGRIF